MTPTIYGYQAFIKTAYVGMTNHRPSRIKATNVTSGKSIFVSWEHGFAPLENHLAAATKLYEKLAAESGTPVPSRVVVCGTNDEKGYIFTAAPK